MPAYKSTLAALALLLMISAPAAAQQVEGVPGAPNATTTIDGRYLPPPPPPFEGQIELNAAQSKPAWSMRVVPPKGAPNVLLIMTDDVGFGAPSTFGGVIPTPALDRIAASGLRYTNFHSTALCSPTRAALITGRNHHSVGFGSDTGTPVDDGDYKVPFKFTGKIAKLTVAVEPPKLTPEDEKKLMDAFRAAQDSQ